MRLRDLKVGPITAAALLLTGCSPLSSKVEVARSVSADQNLIAILYETNGGATTSFGYIIHLESSNLTPAISQDVASLYGAVRSDCAYGVDLKWEASDHLLISYLSTKQTKLLSGLVKAGEKTVFVDLVPGKMNSSAPCGGMEYNLKK